MKIEGLRISWVRSQVGECGLSSVGNGESLKVLTFQTTLYGCSDAESCKARPAWNAMRSTVPFRDNTHPATPTPPRHRPSRRPETSLHEETRSQAWPPAQTQMQLHTHTRTQAVTHWVAQRDTATVSTPRHTILRTHTHSHAAVPIVHHQSLPHPSTSYKKPPATAEGTGRLTPRELRQ